MSPSIHGRILCGQHMCHRVMLPHSSCGQWPPVLATVVPRRFACLYNPSACHLLPPIVASVRACGRLHPPAASLGPASPLTVASSGPLPVSYGLASLPLLVAWSCPLAYHPSLWTRAHNCLSLPSVLGLCCGDALFCCLKVQPPVRLWDCSVLDFASFAALMGLLSFLLAAPIVCWGLFSKFLFLNCMCVHPR